MLRRLPPISSRPHRILDFDIENRPLTYLGQDFTTAEITAIAASFGPDEPMFCWLLGRDAPVAMLEAFRALYDEADIVTGHYIRRHDLPIINGAMAEYGLKPLAAKLTHDTKMDLVRTGGISASQESLSAMLGIPADKVHVNQPEWRAANRLHNLQITERRVTSDVRQHQALRLELVKRGLLKPPKMWSVGAAT